MLREHPELRDIGRLTLWQSIKCVRLVLWDESRKKLISFREMRGHACEPLTSRLARRVTATGCHWARPPGARLMDRRRMANKLELLAISRR